MITPLLGAVYEPFSTGGSGEGPRFVHGELLWLWPIAVTALIAFFWWSCRRRRQLISGFIRSRLLAQLTVGLSARRQQIRLALLVVATAALLLALTRPQWGYDWEEARQQGLDIIVAIDTSRSMLAEDVPPNRFTRARLAALDLLRLAQADRLGLVAFAGEAFLHCPLTLDEEAFRQSLEVLEVGIISQGGTALSPAIETTISAFKDEGDNHRVLVLFTDGEDHDSQIDTAIEAARKANLRIFTVGVGTAAGELLRVTDEQGTSSFVKDSQGNPVKSRLNESVLQQIATSTGGFYLPLRGPEIMRTLYEKGLAPLPRSEHSTRLFRQYRERFQWPLGAALLLLILETLFPERRRPDKPTDPRAARASVAAPTRSSVMPVLFCSALLGFNAHAASPSQALRQYQSGQYPEARRHYQELIEKDPNDHRLHFNSGAAAYREGKFDEAIRSFSDATTAPDLELQQKAFYNLGNSLYRAGEESPDLKIRQQQWQKATQQFEGATQLDPADTNASHNLEFVRRQLEELKKQQQQQQQQPSQDNKEKKDSSDQDQDSSEQDKKQGEDQQQPKDPSNAPQDQKQDQQSQPSESPKDSPQPQGKEQDKQDQPGTSGAQDQKKDDKQQEQQQPQPSTGGKPGETGEPKDGQAAAVAGQMTPSQAEKLLDAQKGNERALIFLPAKSRESKSRIIKDW